MGKRKKSKHKRRRHHRSTRHRKRAKEAQQATDEKEKPFSPLAELYNLMCKTEMEEDDSWDSSGPGTEVVKEEKQEVAPTKTEDKEKEKE